MRNAVLAGLLLAVFVAVGAYSNTRGVADGAVNPGHEASAAASDLVVEFADYDAAYVSAELRGWTVIVNRDLLAAQPELTRRALGLLDTKLSEIERNVYRLPLRRLQKVPIWVEGGVQGLRGVMYHWSADWLRERGYNPEKARSVEIVDLRDFIAWSQTQPWLVMHELAHAYHDRALGEHNEAILAAFENAKRTGLYTQVKYIDGSTRPAYAMTNRMEYFAELTEAYFGVNDFFPFRRDELARHDPQGFALMEQVWRF